MNISDIYVAEDFYKKHLSVINGVKFTAREIDVVSCTVHGRTAKKTAAFFGIAPKTVVTHISNIMLKLECNSRESIIDFMEKSEEYVFLKSYYAHLLIEHSFEEVLKEIGKLKRDKAVSCVIACGHDQDDENLLINFLEKYLIRTGITVCSKLSIPHPSLPRFLFEPYEEKRNRIYILSEANEEEQKEIIEIKPNDTSLSQALVLLSQSSQKTLLKELKTIDIISLEDQDNAYYLVFEVLRYLLPTLDFKQMISIFKKQYTGLQHSLLVVSSSKSPEEHKQVLSPSFLTLKNSFQSRTKFWLLVCILFFMGGVGFFSLHHMFLRQGNLQSEKSDSSIETQKRVHSDLMAFAPSALLQRPELLTQIGEQLKEQNGIKTIALIGMGGAGKTTLARQYAQSQNLPVVWEVNAETRESLKGSFEMLAQSLSVTDEERKNLRALQEVQNSQEREKQLIQFVKDHLQAIKGWLLIYDNVEKFTDIHDYFPNNVKSWGEGSVILTTRDDTIKNNKFINASLQVGELTNDQKFTLFTHIMDEEKNTQVMSQQEEITNFLKEIPSFPLDVSVAAYYLKATNLSLDHYLKRLNQHTQDFENVQQNLLKEAGDYIKTRYSIVTLSLQNLINVQKEFKDLLVFISLIDSQNIPRELLDTYKDNVNVDSFIYNLKKYSLITNEASHDSSKNTSFSLHRSTQAIILAHFTKDIALQQSNQSMENMIIALEKYTAVHPLDWTGFRTF